MVFSRTALAGALCVLTATIAAAQGSAPPLYRVFLSDGRVLASYGEWARVGDQVVFSMPVGLTHGGGDLHLVSLPVGRVDLTRSERYADAVRATQYAATRGDADFAQLSGGVAQALNQIGLVTDPKQRLAIAEQARRTLAEWPAKHFNYRAAEVREFLAVLDDVISGLRVQAGQARFDIALTATTVAPPTEALLSPPSPSEIVEGIVAASEVTQSTAERVSLLRTVVALLDRAVDYLPATVASAIRDKALNRIAEEQRLDAAYAQLRDVTLVEASRYAARADVRNLDRLRERLRAHDEKLGRQRPDDVAAMLATLEEHLDAAHRLRLAQDQWLLSVGRLRDYRRAISPYVRALLNKRRSFEDIRLLAGPAPQRLLPLLREIEQQARFIALIQPPTQLAAVHAAFRSAYSLAQNAVQLRRDAVTAADVELARRASSAAAGALMLLERGRVDLRLALEPPVKYPARP
jgi:hypothetical protein